jgi:hypothetical protein
MSSRLSVERFLGLTVSGYEEKGLNKVAYATPNKIDLEDCFYPLGCCKRSRHTSPIACQHAFDKKSRPQFDIPGRERKVEKERTSRVRVGPPQMG